MALFGNIRHYLSFITNKSTILNLSLHGKPIVPGQYVPRSEAEHAPTISFEVPSSSAKYLVVCIDLDGPYPSFNILSPILHWIQPGFAPSQSTAVLISYEPFIANYIGPGPPPGSSPHRYLFLLYEEPDGFDGTLFAPPGGRPYGNMSRMRFSLKDWEEKANLEDPVAVNYFVSS